MNKLQIEGETADPVTFTKVRYLAQYERRSADEWIFGCWVVNDHGKTVADEFGALPHGLRPCEATALDTVQRLLARSARPF